MTSKRGICMSTGTWSTPAPPRTRETESVQQRAASRVPAWPAPGRGAIAPLPEQERLPRRATAVTPAMWVLGAHGGAGETVLATVLVEAAAASHAWPVSEHDDTPVLLVARTTMSGIQAAQRAVADWASGETGSLLAGVVLIADAPAGLPRHMTELVARLRSVAPRLWTLPWCAAWREAAGPTVGSADRRLRRALTELSIDLNLPLIERNPS